LSEEPAEQDLPRASCYESLLNGCTKTSESVYGFDRNGCTEWLGIRNGETGSGKSTLLQNTLAGRQQRCIISSCESATKFDELILDAFDQLGAFYLQGLQTTENDSSSLGISFKGIQASIQQSQGQASSSQRIVPPQLTVQRLAEFLGANHLCWVLEDFHKVTDGEKRRLAESFKIFLDSASAYRGNYREVRIIAIGATDTAREIVQFDSNMSNRVLELEVPLLDSDELGALISQGQRLLNVSFDAIREELIQYSTGVTSICHRLALYTCLDAGVERTASKQVPLTEEHLARAVARYVAGSSDSLKARFDLALYRGRVVTFDNGRLILTALAGGPIMGMRHAEILAQIHEARADYPSSNLTTYLRLMCGERRGAVLRKTSDGRFRFTDPLHHAYAQVTLLPRQQAKRGVSSPVFNMSEQLIQYMIARNVSGAWSIELPGSQSHLVLDPNLFVRWSRDSTIYWAPPQSSGVAGDEEDLEAPTE